MSAQPKDRHAEIHSLPRAVYTGTEEPMSILDPIYPTKHHVHKGSQFWFHGHSVDKPSLWTVEDITTVSRDERGKLQHSVYNVRTSEDILTMRCDNPWERRRVTFKWLSQSAMWRLKA